MADSDDEYTFGDSIDTCIMGSQAWLKDQRSRRSKTSSETSSQTETKKTKACELAICRLEAQPSLSFHATYPPMPLSNDTKTRIQRALDEDMTIYHFEMDSTKDVKSLSVQVVGKTLAIHTVTLNEFPTCTCPDAIRKTHLPRRRLCKHHYFVLLKVLQVDKYLTKSEDLDLHLRTQLSSSDILRLINLLETMHQSYFEKLFFWNPLVQKMDALESAGTLTQY